MVETNAVRFSISVGRALSRANAYCAVHSETDGAMIKRLVARYRYSAPAKAGRGLGALARPPGVPSGFMPGTSVIPASSELYIRLRPPKKLQEL